MNQGDYLPNERVLDHIAGRRLVLFVGPSAIGKSTLINEITNQDEEFAHVSGFTTREPRIDDEPNLYRYVSKAQVRDLIANRELVQYAIHPATDDIYGTELHDYPALFNMKDSLSGAVRSFRKLPFQRAWTISITAPPEAWRAWFVARYPSPSDDAENRIHEARQSIEWSLAQNDQHHWLITYPDDVAKTARTLIDIVKNPNEQTSLVPDEPRRLLDFLDGKIW